VGLIERRGNMRAVNSVGASAGKPDDLAPILRQAWAARRDRPLHILSAFDPNPDRQNSRSI